MDSCDSETKSCEKCGLTSHTTKYHILFRMNKYDLNMTPDLMCTKCFGRDHLRKHCEIYHLYMKDTESKDYYDATHVDDSHQYKYLDNIYDYEKKLSLIRKLYNSYELYNALTEYRGYAIENKMLFLTKHSYLPDEIINLFWSVLYQEHSKEEVNIISALLY